MIPEWAKQYKIPGTTIKAIGNSFYLYYATSKYVAGKKHPVSVQTYIGRITPDGVVSERVSINVGRTQACLLGELVDGLPEILSSIIVLKVKGVWLYTKLDGTVIRELKERCLYDNGKVVL